MMNPGVQRVIEGMIGGMVGAAAMTVVRLLAHRAGMVDEMVPQHIEQTFASRAGIDPPGGSTAHQMVSQVMHEGYGMACGALFAAAGGGRRRRTWLEGVAFGATVWLVSMFGFGPLVGLPRTPWRANRVENAVNVLSHLVFGMATALVTSEFGHQHLRRKPEAALRRTHVG
jgi:uncharacterized membrane protein YagU involved in acid resistance